MAALSSLALAAAGAHPVGEFENQADVGAPKVAGSARYEEATQEYLMSAGGTDVWSTSDQFHFVWKRLSGDFIVRTRAEFLGPGMAPHRKLGIMVRPGLEADSPYVDGAEHGDPGITALQFRRAKGAATEEIRLPVVGADVLQFERRGRTFIFSAARYGDPFVSARLSDLDLGDDVYVGLFLCSHNPDHAEHALFRNVRIIRPAKPGFIPYRDYIGSRLEVLDVYTGRLLSLYHSAEPFEAPNWTRDGASLIYNVSGTGPAHGLLRRFDLATGQPQPFDTGTLHGSNNDHVLSFDGTMLGVSDQGPETNHRSAVYVLPEAGGQPRLVTRRTPSFLHGWSPDGKFLVFVGGRPEAGSAENEYDIYKIPVSGGEEIRLTRGLGQCDGPEYAPDGKFIYFTATKSGRMQIWRMRPDGSDPEQVTRDDLNNWFPHVSPDGRWVAFISFPADVAPADHPYYRHVYLRLMPLAGGPARVIAYVYGGQGTMNVPSWSPDSRRIAFVSNTDFGPR